MKRMLPFVLVALLVAIGVAAPLPAAADFGTIPYFRSVTSSGSNGWYEYPLVGQAQTYLDHSGPTLEVSVWVPAGAGVDAFEVRAVFAGRVGSLVSSQQLYEGGRRKGVTVTYRWSFCSFTSGNCVVETIASEWIPRMTLATIFVR